MSKDSQMTPQVLAGLAFGWLLLLPIGSFWLKYREGIASGSYSDSPTKSFFTFVPIMACFMLSALIHLRIRKELPNRAAGLFFWVATTPFLAEVFVALAMSS